MQKCQICGKKEATVHLKQVLDGETLEMFLCKECAQKGGLSIDTGLGMAEFVIGLASAKDKEQKRRAEEELSCPSCHMRRADFKKTSRLGCPACYETFAADLSPMLAEMHRGTTHVGKSPRDSVGRNDVAALRKALAAAVAAQRFEEAARLRDLIRAATGGAPSGAVSDDRQ